MLKQQENKKNTEYGWNNGFGALFGIAQIGAGFFIPGLSLIGSGVLIGSGTASTVYSATTDTHEMSVAGYAGSMVVGGVVGGVAGHCLTPPPTRGPIEPSILTKVIIGMGGGVAEGARQKIFNNTKDNQGPGFFAGEKAGSSNNTNGSKPSLNGK